MSVLPQVFGWILYLLHLLARLWFTAAGCFRFEPNFSLFHEMARLDLDSKKEAWSSGVRTLDLRVSRQLLTPKTTVFNACLHYQHRRESVISSQEDKQNNKCKAGAKTPFNKLWLLLDSRAELDSRLSNALIGTQNFKSLWFISRD